jgi:hypothetical protein
MSESSMHKHLFMFAGNSDEELLLALAIAQDQPMENGLLPKVAARDLWELLEEPGAVHPSLSAEWTSPRKVGLALARLRKNGLVKRGHRDPWFGDKTFCYQVTEAGFELLGKRLLFKPERRAS